MGDVVIFPVKPVRDWTTISRKMEKALSESGASVAVRSRITEQLKSFYELLKIDFRTPLEANFPVSLTKEQADAILSDIVKKVGIAFEERLQSFTEDLFVERFQRELRLCHELGLL